MKYWTKIFKNIIKGKKRLPVLFEHPLVNDFESEIVESLGVSLYTENREVLDNLSSKEIALSCIDPCILLSYFTKHRDRLSNFTILGFSKEANIYHRQEFPVEEDLSDFVKPETLESFGPAIGFSITFAIYFHFLKNEPKDDLIAYLKSRRIPQADRFYERLVSYYKKSEKM